MKVSDTVSTIRWPSGEQGGTFGTREQIIALDDRFEGSLRPPSLLPLRDRVLSAWPAAMNFGDGTFPALPSSVARLMELVDRYGRGHSAVLGGDDGLAKTLGAVAPEKADTLVVSVPGPNDWLNTLRRSSAAVFIARVRAPFDVWWKHVIGDSPVLDYVRDAEHYLAPGPWVLDGGGDYWVCESFDRSRLVAELPRHAYRDFDGLERKRCTEMSLRAWANCVAERWTSPSAASTYSQQEESLCATQFFWDGSGYTAQLRPADAHLLVTFPSYNPLLETVVLGSVYEFFGGETMRSRPVRTRQSPTETVL